jgi:hypothetical protein
MLLMKRRNVHIEVKNVLLTKKKIETEMKETTGIVLKKHAKEMLRLNPIFYRTSYTPDVRKDVEVNVSRKYSLYLGVKNEDLSV